MRKIYVTLDEFIEKIIESENYCFICLEHKSSKVFNDEHVIPKWILKHFNLYNKRINLPNSTSFKYGNYVIPCCATCNTELSKFYEYPLSELFKSSFDEIINEIKSDTKLFIKIYHWLTLIFIKTHIKTTFLNKHQNSKIGTGKIGDSIEWNNLHHIYLMSRCHYAHAKIERAVYGSMFFFKSLNGEHIEKFDYVDSSVSRCILLKINELSVMVCFDDGRAGISLMQNTLDKLEGNLHPLQLREILAHLSYINVNLKERPVFQSIHNETYQIIEATFPDSNPQLISKDLQNFQIGDFLAVFVRGYIYNQENKDIIINEIREEKRGYLFDGNENFYSME